MATGFSGAGAAAAGMSRKKSLSRPDRERMDPNHRLYNYRQHAAIMEDAGVGRSAATATGAAPNTLGLRRGKSVLGREEGRVEESGLSLFRGATLRKKGPGAVPAGGKRRVREERKPISPWMWYVNAATFCFPTFFLKSMGLKTKERRSAWREKTALLFIILLLMAGVGFITFGFTQTVCGKPPPRFRTGSVDSGSMIYHGYDYDFNQFKHPAAPGIDEGVNPVYSDFNAGGMDGSFLFQKVNQHCRGIITPAVNTGIPHDGENMAWYFPCNLFPQYGTRTFDKTGYTEGTLCHTQNDARQQFAALKSSGPVYYTWSDVKNKTRNLGVYEQNVLDFDLLNWLDVSQVTVPPIFGWLAARNESYQRKDVTMPFVRDEMKNIANCLSDVIRVGFIDSKTIGCVAADVVLYLGLVFIIGVVAIKFGMAVLFGWFLSWKLGAFEKESYEERRKRAAAVEDWTDDIYRPAPARYRPNAKDKKKTFLPERSRFTPAKSDGANGMHSVNARKSVYSIMGDTNTKSVYSDLDLKPPVLGGGMRNSPPSSPGSALGANGGSASSVALSKGDSRRSSLSLEQSGIMGSCPFPLYNVVPQPPKDYQPFNFPLAHTICLVTAYSESVEGLRTTLDSLATTDFPNSHKLILVICDGMVKGSGNKMTTPEIVLTMMKEFVVPKDEVEAHSYVAIADGHKKHNMAKVYAGFYDYDNGTVERNKQQRVPIVLVAKCGNPLEAHEAKPGNRGKRDSQVLLMTFLQRVMFDERMTRFEYEFFNSIWRCTGVSPDHYQLILMVDADTKVFPDSLTRMVACMVKDVEIMGLCGETKIANKTETWVTMIQVFEYYISHHQTKAFESMFGGVTCLPGCFSMFRIKAPKGGEGYWVPILANPDIVEHYSENVVDTLHKKNLLLLGEDRYLTTLMLKTFPKRKMMFCPQAVCKTIVPDTFRVLLSQRRRWINSTIHNLFELVLVRDLCGTFCFSMQFVVGMELAGTLVLPAAISFTIYLLVITAIPGTTKPIIPLILLGIILGLPGLLIVVTSRKIAYVGWMVIYLLSLPVWNFILPAYAYFRMDDFSWGQTRAVEGEKKKGGSHGDKEGEFDSSNIVMKRWAEFERDRRYRTGTVSRVDSTYDVLHTSGTPRSQRYSVASETSTNDVFFRTGSAGSALPQGPPSSQSFHQVESLENLPLRRRQDTVPVLELPAPLAAGMPGNKETHRASRSYTYDSGTPSRDTMSETHSNISSGHQRRHHSYYESEDGTESQRILRPSAVQRDSSDEVPSMSSHGNHAESSRHSNAAKYQGVSLRDDGPVSGNEGMRVVERPKKRQSSVGAPSSRRQSRAFTESPLPPPPKR
ncbi:glycosyltransferase family 2 protein [Atractiella rhizophila]|nr:glycosyltransferase family 2 protein [Atractiella rhizophila]